MGTYHACPTAMLTQFGDLAEAWMETGTGWEVHFCLDGGTDVTVATGLAAEYPLRLTEADGVIIITYTVRVLGTPTDYRYHSHDAGQTWTAGDP